MASCIDYAEHLMRRAFRTRSQLSADASDKDGWSSDRPEAAWKEGNGTGGGRAGTAETVVCYHLASGCK